MDSSDVWTNGDVTLYRGDCLEVLPTLAGPFDAVVTDPPYGLNFKYKSYNDTRQNLKILIAGFMPLVRAKTDRVFILPGITQVYLYPEPTWIACITWNTTGSFGKFGYAQWMPLLCYGSDIDGFGNVNDGTLKSDVIKISGGAGVGFMRNGEKDEHPCPKPINVMSLILHRFTAPHNLVLDPFMGSGTTGVACVKTGRRFVGIEIERKYFEIAIKRIAEAQMQPPLL